MEMAEIQSDEAEGHLGLPVRGAKETCPNAQMSKGANVTLVNIIE
jgi:hypothetical protein